MTRPERPARDIPALILAAGRGQRMRPLTDTCPKPLLPVGGRPLIEWHLRALARSGVRRVVVNTDWLEAQFPPALGDGRRFGLDIRYSMEGRDHGGALETAGGLATALPLLECGPDDPLWLVSADIHAPQFPFAAQDAADFAARDALDAHLWVVPNPPFHPSGDFALDTDGLLRRPADASQRRWTYANFALVRPRLVAAVSPGQRAPLAPWLFAAAEAGRLSGQAWAGPWENLGTPAQWQALNQRLGTPAGGATAPG